METEQLWNVKYASMEPFWSRVVTILRSFILVISVTYIEGALWPNSHTADKNANRGFWGRVCMGIGIERMICSKTIINIKAAFFFSFRNGCYIIAKTAFLWQPLCLSSMTEALILPNFSEHWIFLFSTIIPTCIPNFALLFSFGSSTHYDERKWFKWPERINLFI